MSAWRFTDNARIIRRVTVDESGNISVTDIAESWFPALRMRTGAPRPSQDSASPRRLRSDRVRFRNGYLGPPGGQLRAGDRINMGDTDFEVLEDPRDFHLGRRIIGCEVPVRSVEKLYPFEGAIQEQGGAPIKAGVRFSIYATDETHDSTGTYENYNAETDLSNAAECRVNHHFVTDGKVYKITASENDLAGGYVRMTVRKAGAS